MASRLVAYSFVGVRAAATLTEQDGAAIWKGHAPVGLPTGGDPLVALRETLRLLHTPRGEGLPPFTSGLVGYLSYDAVRRVERLPDSCVNDLRIPELAFLLASDLAVLDHHNGEVWLVANAINFDNTDERVDEAYADAAARVESMTELLVQPTPAGVVSASFDRTPLPIRRQRTSEEYRGPSGRQSRKSRPARRSRSSSASGSRLTRQPTPWTSTAYFV